LIALSNAPNTLCAPSLITSLVTRGADVDSWFELDGVKTCCIRYLLDRIDKMVLQCENHDGVVYPALQSTCAFIQALLRKSSQVLPPTKECNEVSKKFLELASRALRLDCGMERTIYSVAKSFLRRGFDLRTKILTPCRF
jgi:hypothetical protein